VAPRDTVEKTLVAIWEQLLGVERVGIHDNFFDLGGHSLNAHRVLAALRDRFDAEVELRALFEGPTVAELAVAVAQAVTARAGLTEMESMLADLEGMSEEEVEALLASGQEVGIGH
jgi:acyl carrier protein